MQVVNIAGFEKCGDFQQIKNVLSNISFLYPDKLTVNLIPTPNRDVYLEWLNENHQRIGVPASYQSSPLVWINNRVIGSDSEAIAWIKSFLQMNESAIVPNSNVLNMSEEGEHDYEYDCVVIGGGSGGLACAKEMKTVNPDLKVALLDFVKPSPLGTKWGLGGTCVNVGCIPKKLFHTAALMKDTMKDSASYGWEMSAEPKHNWSTLVNNVQDHIRSLNFGYRVSLRDKSVTYMNKLGKFVGPHELEVSDHKGSKVITSKRFVIATGGRPSPLQCPGGELAISSDDIFQLSSPPGDTCVVGAGYVALECAGFLSNLKQGKVTVMVRSMLLRGFDRDIVKKVEDKMKHEGINIVEGVLPQSIVKLPSGKLQVTRSDNVVEEYDTVLVAIGRTPDLSGLNLQAVNVDLNPKTGKIVCTNEQTSAPHVYAIGDIVDNAPELTPVAIMAGRLLARRLYGRESELMVYKNVATAVFTPLEIGTVGLTEEQAIEQYGAENVDCVMSSFHPLEWTIVSGSHDVTCLAKIVIHTKMQNKVLGMHIAAPNAGEIIQGYAAAFRKGLLHSDLLQTVGIHPTITEEFTIMTGLKSSGEGLEKTGC